MTYDNVFVLEVLVGDVTFFSLWELECRDSNELPFEGWEGPEGGDKTCDFAPGPEE